jgi:hypothetical protein
MKDKTGLAAMCERQVPPGEMVGSVALVAETIRRQEKIYA